MDEQWLEQLGRYLQLSCYRLQSQKQWADACPTGVCPNFLIMGERYSKFIHRFRLPSGKLLFFHALTQEYVRIDNCSCSEISRKLSSSKPHFFCTEEEDNKLLEIFRAELSEPYINTAYFFLTKNCNLSCRYCFERQSEFENNPGAIMSCDTFDKALGFFERLIKTNSTKYSQTRFSLIFYGGEPFSNKVTLHHAIKKVASEIRIGNLPEGRTKMLVVTNGTLLNEEDMKLLKANNVTVTFSLDGDRASSVNRVYSDGKTLAWEKATESFKQCKDYGLDLNVACTLSPDTIQNRESVLK